MEIGCPSLKGIDLLVPKFYGFVAIALVFRDLSRVMSWEFVPGVPMLLICRFIVNLFRSYKRCVPQILISYI